MRIRPVVTVALLASWTVGCSGEPLTGLEAQAAYKEAAGHVQTLPAGPLVFVDGVAIPDVRELDLDPEEILRIELLKGSAARLQYGEEAAKGVIQIYMVRGADSTRVER